MPAPLLRAAILAFRITVEVNDRRSHGFCRPDHGILDATSYEERTWWPLGERCYLRLADGRVKSRAPGWSLTALAGAWPAAVAAGVAGPPQSTRRRLGWVLVVPAVPVAAAVLVTIQPPSLARLVALTSISIGFGSVLGSGTTVVARYVLRGQLLATALGSWLLWSLFTFLQRRDAIGP